MEDGKGRLRDSCQDLLWVVMESKNWRKAGLPKREFPCSSGGRASMVSSTESRIVRILWMIGSAEARGTEDIFRSAADSESEKTKARMRLYVDDERYRS